MVPERNDARKEICHELARRLCSEEGLETARLLQLTGVFDQRPQKPPEATADQLAQGILQKYLGEQPASIGIWKPQENQEELVFVRDDTAPTSAWWPLQKTLTPKKSHLPLRVCLLGESTAAGWFYAPAQTPGRILEQQLQAVRPGIYEVVDLTMVNLQSPMLAELVGAVQQLTPDLLVIFAGNNWPMRLPSYPGASLDDSQAAALALREAGLPGLLEHAHDKTRKSAEKVLAIVAQVAEARGIPVILVVPEVNLADWQRKRPVAWLGGGRTQEWHNCHEKALDCLRQHDAEGAASAAEQMMALDQGTCPTSCELLAHARAAQGQAEQALQLFRKAVDSRNWDNFPSTPSATSGVQEALRRESEKYGFTLVDLPAVFAEHLGSEVPGRRLFLDYCHLTLEGMKVAMAAVAVQVLRLSDHAGHYDLDWPYLVQELPDPQVAVETDALVKFMSALYNTHYGADFEFPLCGPMGFRSTVTQHWLAAAVDAWAGIDRTMLAYVATRSVPLDSLRFSVELRTFYESISALERQSAYQGGLDPDLVESICQLLERSQRGLRDVAMQTFQSHHLNRNHTVDLALPQFHWSVIDRYQNGSGFATEACLFYRARWPSSHFCLIADGARDLRLEIMARLPVVEQPRQGEVNVTLDGKPVGSENLGPHWTRHTLLLAGSELRPGFHKVGLHWPELPSEGDAAVRRIIQRLECGIPTDLHPVFGDLFSLRVTPSGG